MKRTLFFVGIVLGIILVALFYRNILALFTTNALRFKAVPVESGFFVDVKGLKKIDTLFRAAKMGDRIDGISFFEKAKTVEPVLKALQPRGYSFMSDFLNNRFVLAYNLTKPGESEMICIIEMYSSSASDMQKAIESSTAKNYAAEIRDVRGTRVWDIKFNNAELGSWSVSCYRGLCILSTSSSLVDEAILQVKNSKSIVDDKTFNVLKEDGDVYFHLYFNPSRLSDFAQGYSSSASQSYLTSFGKFDDWNALDFIPDKGNGIKVTGVASTNTSQLRFLNGYSAVKNTKTYCLHGKPDNTAFLMSTVIDPGTSGDDNSKQNPLLGDADFNKYVYPWFNKEISYVLTEPVGGDFELPSLAFIKTKDGALGVHLLQPVSIQGTDSSSRFPMHYKEFEINRLQATGLIGKIVPNAFTEFVSPFYAAAGDYIVFSNSLTQLKLYLERFKDKKTLEYIDVPGIKTSSYTEGSAVIYCNLDLLTDLFSTCSSDDCRASIQEEYKLLRSFSPIYLQYVPTGGGMFNISGYVSLHKGNLNTSTKYLWKTELDTTYLLPPQIIYDRSGAEKRIAVQDAKNMLYILDRSGDVIWKKQMEGPVMGSITNIDYYKNEEQQMVFATSKKIYIMNDDGSNVENFPITLPSNAVTPLTVTDMDNDRNYKFFITCDNGNIYGFEKSGKPVAGWNPNPGGKDISSPISYFRYHDKEFLMTISNSGTLTFYNRLGKEAYKQLSVRASFKEPFKADDGKGFSNITNDGTLYRLGFDGKITTTNPPEVDVMNSILDDVDGEPGLEKILLTNLGVDVYSGDTSILYHIDLNITGNASLFLPGGFGFENSFGVRDGDNIYIVTAKGKLLNALPKKGISNFAGADLFNNNQRVIVGMLDENTVIGYLME